MSPITAIYMKGTYVKDSDIRGIVLRKFYDLRKENAIYQLDENDLGPIDKDDYNRIGRQLGEKGLIEWHASISNDGAGRITAYGVDVIESDTRAPFSITILENSTTSAASYDAQIKELEDIVQRVSELKVLFIRNDKHGNFLDTENNAIFKAIAAEAKFLLTETLGSNNDFERQLRAILIRGYGGLIDGPSMACVAEVEQLLHSAVRAVKRRQKAKPTEAAKIVAKPPYVDLTRISELQSLPAQDWDYTKLIRLCLELNIAHEQDCHYAVAMLVRSITDHVPPIFRVTTFRQVVSNYSGTRSFRDAMSHLDTGLRKIADSFLHEQIRQREIIPNSTQVNFSQALDLLLGEVIRLA